MEAVCYAGGPAARGALYGDQQGFGGKLGMLKRSVQRGLQGIDNVYTQVANRIFFGRAKMAGHLLGICLGMCID